MQQLMDKKMTDHQLRGLGVIEDRMEHDNVTVFTNLMDGPKVRNVSIVAGDVA
jgi:hypothetical protein